MEVKAVTKSENLDMSSERDWRLLQYNIPINQSQLQGNDFLIQGTAINSTLTRNGVEFINEELRQGTNSLKNKPLLKDHDNSVDSIVGRTTENVFFNESSQSIIFEAKVIDKSIQEKIKEGLINSVSVGAMVEDLKWDEEKGHYIAFGIDFVELSLVAVPADPNAGFSYAVQAAFDLKQAKTQVKENKNKKMVEEKKDSNESKIEETLSSFAKTLQSISDNQNMITERLNEFENKKVEESAKVEAEAKKAEEVKLQADIEAKLKAEIKEELEQKMKVEEKQHTKGIVSDDDTEKVEEAYSNIHMQKSSSGKGFDLSLSSYGSSKILGGRNSSKFSMGGNE